MAEVFSGNSPCMLGKRVLSPHSHGALMGGGQLDFSSKKRRLGQGAAEQGGRRAGKMKSKKGSRQESSPVMVEPHPSLILYPQASRFGRPSNPLCLRGFTPSPAHR